METSAEVTCEDAPGREASSRRAPSQSQARWPDAALRVVTASVGIATTPAQMHAIGRLRYDLYVARDGKPYECADSKDGLLLEPVDAMSLNFCAMRDDRPLSAVRSTWAKDALHDPHLAPLVRAAWDQGLDETIVNSRFVVRDVRGAQATIMPLFRQVHRSGRLAGARYSLLATRNELIPMFERFGFRKAGVRIDDPVAGALHLLIFDACDLGHLESIRSPLAAHARMFERDPAY